MNRRKFFVSLLLIGMLAGILIALTGCEIQAYGGARTSMFYPDNAMGKSMGDPRKPGYSMPRDSDGVRIGGHLRPGEKPFGGDK